MRYTKEQVREMVEQSGELVLIIEDVVSQKPYTFARLITMPKGKTDTFIGVGFAKVNYPDVFDPAYGERLARIRAYKQIARQMSV